MMIGQPPPGIAADIKRHSPTTVVIYEDGSMWKIKGLTAID